MSATPISNDKATIIALTELAEAIVAFKEKARTFRNKLSVWEIAAAATSGEGPLKLVPEWDLLFQVCGFRDCQCSHYLTQSPRSLYVSVLRR
jgi:hypothetical protein